MSGRKPIQGVVFYPNGMADLFVGNEAFSFHASTDLRQESSGVHVLHLKREGVHVEKHFPGLYLNGGNQIYNVYGLFTNSSSNIFFIMRNDDNKAEVGHQTPINSNILTIFFFKPTEPWLLL